mmetsp:Transcript_17488/g.43600  ORF Transcript_17488/g.43600 Transcript_17488/m.43600 type:complete len:265 (+) Transcript_17488:620-1414(+)
MKSERMLSILHNAHVGRTLHLVKVVVAIIRQEKLITRSGHNVLGHSEPISVRIRVDNVHHLLRFWPIQVEGDVEHPVVLQCEAPSAVCHVVVVDVLHKIELVHHDGNDANYTLVYSADCPCCPASLRCARHEELCDGCTSHFSSPCREGVQSAHSSLGHRQAKKPLWLIRVVDEVPPSEGDNGILRPPLLEVLHCKVAGLIRHLKESSCHHAGGDCHHCSHSIVLIFRVSARLVAVITSGNPKKAKLRLGEVVWHKHSKGVIPD